MGAIAFDIADFPREFAESVIQLGRDMRGKNTKQRSDYILGEVLRFPEALLSGLIRMFGRSAETIAIEIGEILLGSQPPVIERPSYQVKMIRRGSGDVSGTTSSTDHLPMESQEKSFSRPFEV